MDNCRFNESRESELTHRSYCSKHVQLSLQIMKDVVASVLLTALNLFFSSSSVASGSICKTWRSGKHSQVPEVTADCFDNAA